MAKGITKRVRCTEEESAAWERAAGGNFSGWARRVLNDAAGDSVATGPDAPLPFENGHDEKLARARAAQSKVLQRLGVKG